MKLRIHKNSIRLRLSQTDLKRFEETKVCTESLGFSNSVLEYRLVLANQDDNLIHEPIVDLVENRITVTIPFEKGIEWIETDLVGLSNSAYENEHTTSIQILIEKDFQCLHKRPKEDESDSFPNPLAG